MKKKYECKRKPYTIMLTDEELKELDFYARKMDMPKSRLARKLVIMILKDLNKIQEHGFLNLSILSDKIFSKVRNCLLGKGKLDLNDLKDS